MSTLGIVGTAISAALVLGIMVALSQIATKLSPPAPQISADPEVKQLASEAADTVDAAVSGDDAEDEATNG